MLEDSQKEVNILSIGTLELPTVPLYAYSKAPAMVVMSDSITLDQFSTSPSSYL